MPLQTLLNNLRNRNIPWPVMSTSFKYHGLTIGRGWDVTVAKLKETFESSSPEDQQKQLSSLSAIYKEILLSCEKSARFFTVDENIVSQFFNKIDNLVIPDSPFKSDYPNLISEDELNDIDLNIYLTSFSSTSNKATLIFCSKRLTQERIDIKATQFEQSVQDILNDFSEVIGIKNHNRQHFDIVVIDKTSNGIEIRLDYGKSIPSNDREASFRHIQNYLQELISEVIETEFILSPPIDLFPVINSLYHSDDGRICELAFTTETGSIKHEKMRRRDECLRSEAYHKGGSAAVDGNLSVYKIAATWEYTINDKLSTQPELLLPGVVRMLSQTNTSLNDVIISNCASLNDYSFITGKLEGFLEQNESNESTET